MDHATKGGAPPPTSPAKGYHPKPQSSGTADSAVSAESSGHRSLTRALSTPTHAIKRNIPRRALTDPAGPRRKLTLGFHPTLHPKEELPTGFPIPSLEKAFDRLLEAPRPVGDAPSFPNQLRNIAMYSWLNVLLVFLPISWVAVSDFPLILVVPCRQGVSHCLSYSSGPTLMCTSWY